MALHRNHTDETDAEVRAEERAEGRAEGRAQERAAERGDGRYADEHDRHAEARSRFGGTNGGAVFFGWLVAIGVTVLLSSIVAAVATALGVSTNLTQDQAQRQAGAVSLAAAIAVVVVLMIGYYAGGYVSGRMSRFDGGRQGFGVWLLGLVITILAVVIGGVFGSRYNVLDNVNLPRIPIPTDTATVGGIITGIVILLGTLLAAILGGKAGRRYHHKVDRVLIP